MTNLLERQIYRQRLLIAAVLSVLVFIAYLPALGNGFVNFDDPLYVYEDLRIRSLDFATVRYFFTNLYAANWHPLTMLSLALDYSVWGLNPLGYHLTNQLIHALNTFLAAVLAMKLVERSGLEGPSIAVPVTGAVTALLFGLHPVHVESVAWVSERKDVLCGLFFLLSLTAYTRYAAAPTRKPYYWAALFFAAQALMSKPMAVTLPLVLLILDFYPFGRLFDGAHRLRGSVLLEKAPFFILSLLIVIITVKAQEAGGAVAQFENYPLAARLYISVHSVGFYIYKSILPLDLAPFYPLPLRWDFTDPSFLASAAFTAFATAVSIVTVRSRRYLAAAWLYYIVTLLPVMGLIQTGRQAAADRYMYIPSLGLFILAASGVGYLFARYRGNAARVALAAVLSAASVLMISAALAQEAVWKDSLSLWTHEIKVYPLSHRFVYVNRGLEYQRLGRLKEALDDFNTAAGIPPSDDTNPYINRGHVYSELGDLSSALDDFNRSINLFPGDINAYYNRGLVYQRLGNCELAVADYSKMISSGAVPVNSRINRGICFAVLRKYTSAAEDLEGAAALEPGNQFIYLNLGKLYTDMGRPTEAAANFKKAAGLGSGEAKEYLKRMGAD